MRRSTVLVVLALVLGALLLSPNNPRALSSEVNHPIAGPISQPEAKHTAPSGAPAKVEFTSQIQPILASRCMPCHFPGGSMHEQLPFDQPKTIKTLGEKLFTRIKDENEQRVIREFLAQL